MGTHSTGTANLPFEPCHHGRRRNGELRRSLWSASYSYASSLPLPRWTCQRQHGKMPAEFVRTDQQGRVRSFDAPALGCVSAYVRFHPLKMESQWCRRKAESGECAQTELVGCWAIFCSAFRASLRNRPAHHMLRNETTPTHTGSCCCSRGEKGNTHHMLSPLTMDANTEDIYVQ